MIQGADWAHYQGSQDFKSLADKGLKFAILKATDGTSYSYADSWYAVQLPRLLAEPRISPGAYHMLINGEDPVNQAGYFASYLHSDVRIAALDYEFNEVRKTKPTDTECRAFAARLNTLRPSMSKWIYGLESDVHRLKTYPEFSTWVRWIAKYSATPPTGYDVWQYGAWLGLDGDTYPGTLDQFAALIGGGTDMALDATTDKATFEKMLASSLEIGEGRLDEVQFSIGMFRRYTGDAKPAESIQGKGWQVLDDLLAGGGTPSPVDIDAVIAALVAKLSA